MLIHHVLQPLSELVRRPEETLTHDAVPEGPAFATRYRRHQLQTSLPDIYEEAGNTGDRRVVALRSGKANASFFTLSFSFRSRAPRESLCGRRLLTMQDEFDPCQLLRRTRSRPTTFACFQ